MKEEILKSGSFNLETALGLSAAAGITAGVIISLKMDEGMLRELCGVEEKLRLASEGQWLRVFFGTFSGVGLLLGAAFLLGFCALSQPAELLLTAFRGLGLGVCVRGVYLTDNVLISIPAFVPFAVLSTWVLVLASREAFRLSVRYFRLSVTSENRLGIRNEIRDYIIRFIIYLMAAALLALADAFLAGVLAKL